MWDKLRLAQLHHLGFIKISKSMLMSHIKLKKTTQFEGRLPPIYRFVNIALSSDVDIAQI